MDCVCVQHENRHNHTIVGLSSATLMVVCCALPSSSFSFIKYKSYYCRWVGAGTFFPSVDSIFSSCISLPTVRFYYYYFAHKPNGFLCHGNSPIDAVQSIPYVHTNQMLKFRERKRKQKMLKPLPMGRLTHRSAIFHHNNGRWQTQSIGCVG